MSLGPPAQLKLLISIPFPCETDWAQHGVCIEQLMVAAQQVSTSPIQGGATADPRAPLPVFRQFLGYFWQFQLEAAASWVSFLGWPSAVACLPLSPTAPHQAGWPAFPLPSKAAKPSSCHCLSTRALQLKLRTNPIYNLPCKIAQHPCFDELKHRLQSSDNYIPIDPLSIQAFNVSKSMDTGFHWGSYLTFFL